MSQAPATPSDLPPDEVLAAELAFGLLDAPERRAAEARRAHDPAFDALCRLWLERTVTLLDGDEVAPDAETWRRILAHLPANDTPQVMALRRVAGRWRAAALAMAAAALGLGAFSAARLGREVPPPPPTEPLRAAPLVVILTSPTGTGVASVSIDRVSGEITAATHPLDVGRHSAELWIIPADKTPRSLGLLPVVAPGGGPVPGRSVDTLAAGATFAVSVEPLGGSPSGKPTGPIILTGKS